MNKTGLSNAGELTVVRLEQQEYATTDDISGIVELANARRKEITGLSLELTTWRHIALQKSGRSSVEQVRLIFVKQNDLLPCQEDPCLPS